VSREETFERDLEDWQDMARHLAALSREVAEDMAALGVRGKTVTAKVRFSDFETRTRARTLPEAVDSEEDIRRAAFECLSRVEVKGRKVRLLGVRMGNLSRRKAS
jgi:DNA polymerase-4